VNVNSTHPERKRSSRFRDKTARRAEINKSPLGIDYFFELSKRSKQNFAALWRWISARGKVYAVAIRRLAHTAIRGASSSARNFRTTRSSQYVAGRPKLKSVDVVRVAVVLVCICLGLLSVGAVAGIALLVQTHRLKIDIAQMNQEVAATKRRLTDIENTRQTQSLETPIPITKAQPPRAPPLTLTSADIQIVRQFIKVAPPSNGARQTIAIGDDLPELAARPLPEPLVEALPKLQGARFSIDQAGAIVIMAAGSHRVDAVISYR
jgi:hypothetical protein